MSSPKDDTGELKVDSEESGGIEIRVLPPEHKQGDMVQTPGSVFQEEVTGVPLPAEESDRKVWEVLGGKTSERTL